MELGVRRPRSAHKCKEMVKNKKCIRKIEVNEKKTMPDNKSDLEAELVHVMLQDVFSIKVRF